MNLTKADVAALVRRRAQPVKAAGELLAVWVPGKLRNPLNGLKHWRAEQTYRREWKERVALALLEAGTWRLRYDEHRRVSAISDTEPKVVRFLASTHNAMDSDGLQAALKPVRDALCECGVVSGDAERDEKHWEYAQRIDRTQRGIEIRVRLRG